MLAKCRHGDINRNKMRWLLLFFLSLFVSCSNSSSGNHAEQTIPQRIISFTPSLTETLFVLGAGNRVLGTTEWCNYPPEAKTRARLGGIGNPNYERILSLNPDLFVISAALGEIAGKVERMGIRVLRVPCDTLADVELSFERVGSAIGKTEEAKKFREDFQTRLKSIQTKLSDRERPKVLLVLERQSGTVLDLSVVGSKNVIDDLIRLAGAQNLFEDALLAYPKMSKEEILTRDPQYILDFSVHGYAEGGNDAQELAAWKALPTLRAVREGNIHIMPEGFDLYPGPRVPQIIEHFASIFHPELFSPQNK